MATLHPKQIHAERVGGQLNQQESESDGNSLYIVVVNYHFAYEDVGSSHSA